MYNSKLHEHENDTDKEFWRNIIQKCSKKSGTEETATVWKYIIAPPLKLRPYGGIEMYVCMYYYYY